MTSPSLSIRSWARNVLDAESALASSGAAEKEVAMRVCEKLQDSLRRFVGPDGVTALTRRAVAMARNERAALSSLKVARDGRVEGWDTLAATGHSAEAAMEIVSHLLWLLVTFIGESLTLRLVRDVWPDTKLDDK
jgi:hypothetical protein